jgi:hypothetical protein
VQLRGTPKCIWRANPFTMTDTTQTSTTRPFQFTGRIRSFHFAFRGILRMIRCQHNAWIHAAATLLVLAAVVFNYPSHADDDTRNSGPSFSSGGGDGNYYFSEFLAVNRWLLSLHFTPISPPSRKQFRYYSDSYRGADSFWYRGSYQSSAPFLVEVVVGTNLPPPVRGCFGICFHLPGTDEMTREAYTENFVHKVWPMFDTAQRLRDSLPASPSAN